MVFIGLIILGALALTAPDASAKHGWARLRAYGMAEVTASIATRSQAEAITTDGTRGAETHTAIGRNHLVRVRTLNAQGLLKGCNKERPPQ